MPILAASLLTGASLGNGTYTYAAGYDATLRLTSASLTRTSDSTVLFQTQPSYDAVGNVVGVGTTLPAGTDNQAFCYDEQNRLTWAGSTGTPSCGRSLTPGSLGSAQYTQTFSYDNLDRLTSGPLGSYTYGDSAHKHAVTAIGSTYTASYGASGNMICRAPTGGQTCSGTPTGAILGYDNDGRQTREQWLDSQGQVTRTISSAYNADGELIAASDPDSVYVYNYDADGRVTTVDNAGTPGVPHVVLTAGYDTAGDRTSLADNLGGTAAVANLPEGSITATIESKTNFFQGIPVGDTARAECTPLHMGRTTTVWQTRITRADVQREPQ